MNPVFSAAPYTVPNHFGAAVYQGFLDGFTLDVMHKNGSLRLSSSAGEPYPGPVYSGKRVPAGAWIHAWGWTLAVPIPCDL